MLVYRWRSMLIEAKDLGDGVRLLTLNRPPANAIDVELLHVLATAADNAHADATVRAVVVTGRENFFSGGLDLKAMAAGQARDMAAFGGADGIFRLWTLPKPTVAMVNGHAVAGGCILALACDFRIAVAGTYKIGLNESAIGLALPTGAFEIARLAIARRHARRVLLEADLYGPEAAREMGLVDEVVPAANLEARGFELARKLGGYPGPAYAANKRSWQRLAVERVRNEPPEIRSAIFQAWTSEEAQRAFLARIAAVTKR
jgi:enoyl-CoA hydratase